MNAWTDYPILELGDVAGQEAPIRECTVLAYDGDKYADVIVGGVRTNFKAGYLYPKPQRCGDGPSVSRKVLSTLGGQSSE